jgi:hypothetical protein
MYKFRLWDPIDRSFFPGPIDKSYFIQWDTNILKLGHHPETILTQFTGVLDKDGVEIYEGDIVHFADRIGEVTFHRGAFLVGKQVLCYERSEQLKVLGNVFENPSLLNAPQPPQTQHGLELS